MEPAEDDPPDNDAVRHRHHRQRRQQVAHWIHGLWTDGGSNDAGLVEPWLDGRLRLLGQYVTLGEPFPDDDHEADGAAPHHDQPVTDRDDDEDPDYGADHSDTSGVSSPAEPSSSLVPFITTIDRVHCNDLTYDEFVARYMQPNVPVIISGLADNWRASREWTVVDESVNSTLADGAEQLLSPNVEYLGKLFGEDVVKVMEQSCPGLGSIRPIQKEMTIAEFATYWKEHHSARPSDGDNNAPILYLKDYKFVVKHPDYAAYEWPHYFREDWLNDATGQAYKFVYLGPKGSSTVLHADVLRSYSWSTNVCGRKRWVLVPPSASWCLYDCFGTRLATHLHADVGELTHLFPALGMARSAALEVIQEPGETIFVPSNVYHTVENLEATLSINHNWINGHNVHHCWRHVQSQVVASRRAHRQNAGGEQGGEGGAASAQVLDDLRLLWNIVSQHVDRMLRQIDTAATDEGLSSDVERDCRASLLVVIGMLELLHDDDYQEIDLERDRVTSLATCLQGVLSSHRHVNAPK